MLDPTMNTNTRNHISARSFMLVGALFGALLFACAARTQAGVERVDKNVAVAPAPEPFNWTGFYIGGNLGGILSHYDTDSSDVFVDVEQQRRFFEGTTDARTGDTLATFTLPRRGEKDGAPIGGGQVGFNFQAGHFVFGIEGDFDRTSTTVINDFRDTATTTFTFNGTDTTAITDFNSIRTMQTNWVGSLRGRVGYATGRLLFYGTGGITWADVNVWANESASTNFFVPPPGTIAPAIRSPQITRTAPVGPPGTVFILNQTNSRISREDDTRAGWTAGGGVELAVSDTVSFGLEYRHNDFGDGNFDSGNRNRRNGFANGIGGPGPIFARSSNVSLDSDQVTFRMNILLSHMFGHHSYASTGEGDKWAAADGNMDVAYHRATDGKERMSAKDQPMMVKQEEPFSWTGFYLGGNVGGAWTDYDFGSYNTDVDLGAQGNEAVGFTSYDTGVDVLRFGTPGFDSQSDHSLTAGGQLGYQYQFGHFVAGVEGDFNGQSGGVRTHFAAPTQFSSITSTGQGSDLDTETNFLTTRDVESTWTGSARGRLGYANGRVLLYVTGGVAFTDLRVRSRDIAVTDFFLTGVDRADPTAFVATVKDISASDDQEILTGWTGGGGAEWAMTNIVSVGLDYRHNGFGDQTFRFAGRRGPLTTGSTRVDLDSDQVTLRVNFLLGRVHGP